MIAKSHVILVFGHPFFISRKEQLDRFQQCKGYLYQVLVATQTVWWLYALDCLKHKPFSISARLFCHFSSDFLNFLLLHLTSSLTQNHFSFNLYQFTAYLNICRGINGKDHYMQLKLGDISTIKIKNHAWCFAAKNMAIHTLVG